MVSAPLEGACLRGKFVYYLNDANILCRLPLLMLKGF